MSLPTRCPSRAQRTGWAWEAWQWARPAIRFTLPLFIANRAWLSVFAALILSIFPPVEAPSEYWRGISPVTEGVRGWLLGPWQRWDALWYLRIASRGYSATDGSTAFFPLYPWLVRFLALLLGKDYLFASLAVANVACLLTLVLLYKLTCLELDRRSAQRAVVYQLVFPTAFFLFAPYTESLFLLWTIGCFYAARRGLWWLAGILGLLAALTRSVGVLLVLPLACELWRQKDSLRDLVRRRSLSLGLIPLGTATYSLYLAMALGDPLLWLNSHAHGRWGRSFAWPWETACQIVRHLFQPLNNTIDLLFLASFVVLTVLAFRRLPAMYGAYMAISLLVAVLSPSASAPLYSMPRIVLVLFPGFMVLGQVGRRKRWHRLILYSSLLLLTFFTALWLNWFWVA